MATKTEDVRIRLSLQDQASRGLASFKKNLLGFGAAYFSFKAVTGAITSIVKATAEAEEAWNGVAAALKLHGHEVDSNLEKIKAFADGYQTLTGESDEAIGQATQTFIDFGATVPQAMERVRAAADLAAGGHMNLLTAVDLVAKASVGFTATLGRYGIKIDENIPKSERFAAVLNQINGLFGGRAAAQSETLAVKLKVLNERFGDLQETIGEAVVGPLTQFTGWLADQIHDVDRLKDKLALLAGPIPAIANAFGAFDESKTALELVSEEAENLKKHIADVQAILANPNTGADFAEEGRLRLVELNEQLALSLRQREALQNGMLRADVFPAPAPGTTDDIRTYARELGVAAESLGKVYSFSADKWEFPTVSLENLPNEDITKRFGLDKPIDMGTFEGQARFNLDELIAAPTQHSDAIDSLIEEHKKELEDFYNDWQRKASETTSVVFGSFDQMSSGVTEILFGMRNGMRDIFKGIAMDWTKYFIDLALGNLKIKFAGTVVSILGSLFDNPVNDAMLMREGRRAAMFFHRGWDNEFARVNMSDAVYRRAATALAPVRAGGQGTTIINNNFNGVVTQDFQDETIRRTALAAKRRTTDLATINNPLFGGSLVLGVN